MTTETRATTSVAILLGQLAVAVAVAVAGCHARPDPLLIERRSDALYRTGDRVPQPGDPLEDGTVPTEAEVAATADLDRYLSYGLHHNAGLRAAYERWRADLERVPQVTSLPDPQLSFTQFVEEVQTRTGPQERRYSLQQTLPWFGKLDQQGTVASARAEEQWQRVQAVRVEVARDIRVAFHDYAYLGESLRITGEVFELLKQLEPIVQQRIAAGSAGQGDLLRLQVEIGRVENELAGLREVRASSSARLAAAMNLRHRAPLPLPALAEPTAERLHLEAEALLRRAEELNPQLAELRERITANRSARELAGYQRYPDVTLGVDYIETGSAVAPVAGSGDDPWGVRVMFNLPIWSPKYRAAEREADHQIAAAAHALSNRRETLRAELEHAAFLLDDAARQVVLYRDTLLPRAREGLEVTRTAYRSGSASVLDLIDSERALLEFETGYRRACRDHHQSLARLEALVGGEIEGGTE